MEITIKREELNIRTIHDLISDLTESLNLTEEQQFQVTAKVKRLIHSEKSTVYGRMRVYFSDLSEEFRDFVTSKHETHMNLAQAPDDKVVTWSVGTFKYKG